MVGSSLSAVVVGMLSSACRRMWGFPPRMIPVMVTSMGPMRGLRWFVANMPRYLVTMYVLGPLRAHLACVVISLYNGCVYCAYGHTYAIELRYFRDHGRLFPLDATTLSQWLDLEPRQLAAQLRSVLQEAGLHAEAMWVDRILALTTGTLQPIDRQEARLAHVVRMVGRINEIAVAHDVLPDEAHDTINKDGALKERYAAMRAAVS